MIYNLTKLVSSYRSVYEFISLYLFEIITDNGIPVYCYNLWYNYIAIILSVFFLPVRTILKDGSISSEHADSIAAGTLSVDVQCELILLSCLFFDFKTSVMRQRHPTTDFSQILYIVVLVLFKVLWLNFRPI